MRKIFLTMMAAALLVVGLTSCGGKSGANASDASDDSFDAKATPLTVEAIEECDVVFSNRAEGLVTYQVNGDDKQTIAAGSETTIHLGASDKVAFWGDNPTYYPTGHLYSGKYSNIRCTKNYYAYGNVMSLINSTGFATLTALDPVNGKYAFGSLFAEIEIYRNNVYCSGHLRNHETKKLVLPATTLSEGCYAGMFHGCVDLKILPELPATTLAPRCYSGMFEECWYFDPPALPATTLAEECYGRMFGRCYLTTAPALPATTLAPRCYAKMFYKCSNLSTAPALPATTLAEGCYSGMFIECKNLTTAPDLPAPKLVSRCYESMFSECSKLNYIKCLATDFGVTMNWRDYGGTFYGVAASGTFVKDPSVSFPFAPYGWTVKDAE